MGGRSSKLAVRQAARCVLHVTQMRVVAPRLHVAQLRGCELLDCDICLGEPGAQLLYDHLHMLPAEAQLSP